MLHKQRTIVTTNKMSTCAIQPSTIGFMPRHRHSAATASAFTKEQTHPAAASACHSSCGCCRCCRASTQVPRHEHYFMSSSVCQYIPHFSLPSPCRACTVSWTPAGSSATPRPTYTGLRTRAGHIGCRAANEGGKVRLECTVTLMATSSVRGFASLNGSIMHSLKSPRPTLATSCRIV
jgi:hypothetical protein